jgi:multidrug efflux pump subunit AcrA (membrane-fusion protein)
MAELDTTDVLNDVKQSEVSLNNAQVRLAQTVKGATEKDLLSATNTITSGKSRITTLENDRVNIVRDQANKKADFENQIVLKQNEIKNNKNDVTSKQAQLENAKNELATLEKSENKGLTDDAVQIAKTLDSALIDAKKQMIDAEASLYNADEILGISDVNRTKNDNYEVYLSANDSTLKSRAVYDWGSASSLLSEAKSLLGALPQNPSSATGTLRLLDTLAKVQSVLVSLGKDGSDAVNASIASANFSQATMDSYANIFSSITSSAQSALTSVKNTAANLNTLTDPAIQLANSNNAIRSKRQSVTDLETAFAKLSVDTAQQLQRDLTKLRSDMEYSNDTYKAKLASQDISIQEAKNSLKYSEESYRLLKEGATKEEIALAKNSIASQQISLQKVKEGIKKYQLEAPFDGVLRKIDFKLGDNIVTSSNATPAYIYIENPNLVEISVSVDQLDVVKLKMDQEAKIVFDSFPKITFTGAISDINSTPTVTSGVTSYSVKITMDKGKNAIFSGMSAKVNIINDRKDDTLTIGTSFVQKGRDGKASVLKRVGSADTKTDIEIGISTPSTTEILSGVNEGDVLIRKIATSTGSAPSGGLQIPGVGGGGGRPGGTGGGGGGGMGRGG